MKLFEVIISVLKGQKEPLSCNELARKINNSDSITKINLKVVKGFHIKNTVIKHDDIFTIINDYVVLREDKKWHELLKVYFNLIENSRGILNISDQEFVVTALFFYKRLIDLNHINLTFERNINSNLLGYFNESDINFWLTELDRINIPYNINQNIFSDLKSNLSRLRPSELKNIINNIFQFNTSLFSIIEFGKAFEYIIEIHNYGNTKTSLVRTSRDIIELMTQILNPNEANSIYDPVCGTGGFLSYSFRLNQNLNTYGSEINYKIAQIAQMNQIMNGDYNSIIRAENCFDQIDNNDLLYDLIIGDLPLTGISFDQINQLSQIWGIDFPKKAKGFGAFILFSLSKLNNNGRAAFTVSDSFLFKSGNEQKIRRILLDNDYIEAVISLPNGILKPYTAGKASIIVLNKNKSIENKRKIKFIITPGISDSSNFDVNEILDIYKQKKENNYSRIVEVDDVYKINSLDPNYYTHDFFEIRKLLISGKAKNLSELVSLKSGTKILDKADLNTEEGTPFIRIENLEREVLDMYLDEKSIKDYVYFNPFYDRYIIDKECILIAKIGENIKPTYFKPTLNGLNTIIIHPNVIAIFPKDNKELSLEFLYYQLYNDIVQTQIERKLSRSIVPFITLNKLRELIIPYVDYLSQQKIIDVEKTSIITSERSKIDEKIKRLGYKEEAEERELNVVRTITHQLRHNLSGIAIMMDKLGRIVTKRNLLSIKEYDENDPILISQEDFEQPENKSLEEIIEKASRKAQTLNTILLDVEKAINLNLSFTDVELFSFMKNISKEYSKESFSIEIIGDKTNIEISTTHFEDLINTLIDNAKVHGFNKKKTTNKIVFKIKPDFNRNIVQLEYQNNGAPLIISPEEYTSILTKSIGSKGSGIGGYYINKIIEAHQGALKIDENYKKGMKIIFELPLKQIEHE